MNYILKTSFFVTITFFSIFIYSIVGVPIVSAQYTSDGSYFPVAGPIEITSPDNITYNTNDVILNVTSKYLLGPKYASFCYSLDETSNVTIPLTGIQEPREVTRTYENGTIVIVNSTLNVPFTLYGQTTLSDLPEGPHKIEVYANYTFNNVVGYDKNTIVFTIETNSETKIPEFPSFIIFTLILMGIIVVICRSQIDR